MKSSQTVCTWLLGISVAEKYKRKYTDIVVTPIMEVVFKTSICFWWSFNTRLKTHWCIQKWSNKAGGLEHRGLKNSGLPSYIVWPMALVSFFLPFVVEGLVQGLARETRVDLGF